MGYHPLLINLSALIQKPTGISVYAHNLLPELKQLNPTVISSEKLLELSHIELPDGLSPEYGLKGHIRRLWWLQNSLPKLYRSLESDLIFSPLPEAPIYKNCRFIITVHDLIPLRFPRQLSPLTNYFRYLVPLILKEAVHIICDSDSTARDLKQFYKIQDKKVTTIPLAYDAANFQFKDRALGNYFLYIGRQDIYKNLRRLIIAFSQICNTTDTELWLVGPQDPRYTPQLNNQIQHLGIDKRVRFLDYVPYTELPNLLGSALALAFPSLWEGFGLPMLEAMACGTPVIASNLSSLPEVAGDAAVLIDPYQVDELAAAMSMVANDAQLRNKLRKAGLEQAQKFSWDKTGRQTAEVLQKFL